MHRPALYALGSASLAAFVVIALIARSGTSVTRLVAAALAALVSIGVAFALWRGRRKPNDARVIVRQVIAKTDRAEARRVQRALSLLDRTERAPGEGSAALARLHFERVVEAVAPERVAIAAARRVRRYRWASLVLAVGVLGAFLLGALHIVEGLNVLAAREGRAPLAMLWLDRRRIVAKPPGYLRAPSRTIGAIPFTQLPRGTELTFRGRPRHPGRPLVVSDGQKELPFVSDGAGGVVAHYTVEREATLFVAARFGDVLIPEPDTLRVVALPDQAPRVVLQGAPSTLRLSEVDRLELRWMASDDHGLKQVDLVLRSGHREERRTLASLDGETTFEQGGHVLTPRDPFLRTLYLPAEITIEARDGDPVDGSKWGKSQPIVAVPPAVGEPEALRYRALVLARDRFVDALALVPPGDGRLTREERAHVEQALERAAEEMRRVVAGTYGGLVVPSGVQTFLLGRLRGLTAAVARQGPSETALGGVVLAIDSLLASLSQREAREVAKVLGEVAEEAAFAAELAGSPEGNRAGLERLDKAIVAIEQGAHQLLELGLLGNDLGLVALGDLGRVQRARERGDLFHTERAARHLAERLRRPEPSFGAMSSSSGGVEAGAARNQGEPSESPSDADQHFDELARDIAQLAQQHAEAVEQVDRTLSEASSGGGDQSLKQEAARRAQAIRDAIEGLPMPGASPGSSEAALAMGREQAAAMARQLENLDLAAAARAGRAARDALADAQRGGVFEPDLPDGAEAAREAVSQQLDWVEQAQRAAEQRAREATRAPLEQAAELESELARVARALAERGEQASTPLPEEVTERLRRAEQVMQDASRNLGAGDGPEGLRLQREAQRLLEQADRGATTDPAEEGGQQGGEDVEGEGGGFGGQVPEAEQKSRAEEFRKRVLKNLGDNRGQMAPAVKRYAEGLLR